MRERLKQALKAAMLAKDAPRISTLRLILAAIKDRDIAARGEGGEAEVPDTEILAIFGRMIRQREEAAQAYEEGGRLELAEQERTEIAIIREFMPKPMTAEEVGQAIAEAVAETRAEGIRDMGRVMAFLKERHPGRMDFAKAGPLVKAALA